jgi:predicted RNA-binding Zn ribbon-like protein
VAHVDPFRGARRSLAPLVHDWLRLYTGHAMTCQTDLPVTLGATLWCVDVAELKRQVEYKFAPVPLLAVQALANTFAFEPEEERLLDARSARRWLVESDLVVPEVEVGEREFERLVEFRSVVRELIDANLTGELDAEAARAFAHFAESHPPRLTSPTPGALTLDLSPAPSVDGFIAQIVGIVYQAQLTGQWERLKVCASDECRWAFYDTSRNRSGTWCQMEVCGNKIKNRAYRRRRRAASH